MTTLFTFVNPTDLILEIPTSRQNQADLHTHPISRYQTYINELCLSAVLPWLQEDFTPQAKVWTSTTALPSFWELVNGTAVNLDATRFILVPNETIDLGELRVPQEWVDLPTWAGDYYLAVQVEPDEGYVRVWGYCTHVQLKNQGSYDPGDRSYVLDADFITDISVLAVAQELCTTEPTRSPILDIPILSQTQAQNLITRLGNPQILTPRLEIPFPLWGGLMEHGGWRQSLYQQRVGLPEQWSILQWLQNGVSQVAETIGWGRLNLHLSAAGARSVAAAQPQAMFSRQLAIAGQTYELSIIPQGEPEDRIWRFQLRHTIVARSHPRWVSTQTPHRRLTAFPQQRRYRDNRRRTTLRRSCFRSR